MSTSTYILDSALVLLVVIQMKERVLTNMALIRPFVILAVAVASYFSSIPTQGNDIPLIIALTGLGSVLGLLSGVTVIMRRNDEGLVTARAGAASAIFWVLGMGSRFAFAVWAASASGLAQLTHFSALHHLTSGNVWTDALLGMAVGEVVLRSLVMIVRRNQLRTSTAKLVLA